MQPNYKRTKLACYTVNVTMALVGNLSPLLFLTFRNAYGISYSLLGLLVLINFSTQLLVDLIFSFFSHKFNIPATVRTIPWLTVVGLSVYALSPQLFPQTVYAGLVIGTVIASAASGLAEVLISPTIAAIPSKNPEREMSLLHSIYAWGVVGVVLVATAFFLCLDATLWQYLVAFFLLIPLASGVLFIGAPMPVMETPTRTSGAVRFLRQGGVWLCILAIFLGGAAECTMAQWASGYLERALGIPKMWGDVCGVAMFAAALGFGRSLYSKIGKQVARTLLWGAVGATVCYLVAALSPYPVLGLVGCALTGFCVSMLWPGSLLVASERYPHGGVLIFALMAAGGDMGASFGPQLVGIVTDWAMENPAMLQISLRLSVSAEQVGMKLGLLLGALFPLCAIPVYAYFRCRERKKTDETQEIPSEGDA